MPLQIDTLFLTGLQYLKNQSRSMHKCDCRSMTGDRSLYLALLGVECYLAFC
jgi:hypothetical protein